MKNLDVTDFPADDLRLIAKWRSNERINAFIRPGMRTLSEVEKWYGDYFSGGENHLYSVRLDGRAIGYFTIEHMDKGNGAANSVSL